LRQINIRGKTRSPQVRNPSYDDEKELHDCFDCDDCLCEELCKKYEDKNFTKKSIKKVTKKEGDVSE